MDVVILGLATYRCDVMRRKQFSGRDRDKLEPDNFCTQHLFLMSELNFVSVRKHQMNDISNGRSRNVLSWLAGRGRKPFAITMSQPLLATT